MIGYKFALSVSLLALGATAAHSAVLLDVQSYSGPNGAGQANGGSFNYWDLDYGGGGHNIDGEPLSGGTGDLTDGVVAGATWGAVENSAGTGPYVGWISGYALTANPLITFNFAGAPTIESIRIHLDNSGSGGVTAPDSILVNGNLVAFSAPSGVGWAEATGLNLTGSSHTLQLFHSSTWIFVSEVEFYGTADTTGAAVPEPASWAMMIGGLGLVGAGMRRRRARVAFA